MELQPLLTCIEKKGFIGGGIASCGIEMSINALYGNTAKLPHKITTLVVLELTMNYQKQIYSYGLGYAGQNETYN